MTSASSSRYGRGVYKQDRPSPYRVHFYRNKRMIHVGSFKRLADAQAAAQAWLEAETKEKVTEEGVRDESFA